MFLTKENEYSQYLYYDILELAEKLEEASDSFLYKKILKLFALFISI